MLYFISHWICWYRKVVSQSDYRLFILACSGTEIYVFIYIIIMVVYIDVYNFYMLKKIFHTHSHFPLHYNPKFHEMCGHLY